MLTKTDGRTEKINSSYPFPLLPKSVFAMSSRCKKTKQNKTNERKKRVGPRFSLAFLLPGQIRTRANPSQKEERENSEYPESVQTRLFSPPLLAGGPDDDDGLCALTDPVSSSSSSCFSCLASLSPPPETRPTSNTGSWRALFFLLYFVLFVIISCLRN